MKVRNNYKYLPHGFASWGLAPLEGTQWSLKPITKSNQKNNKAITTNKTHKEMKTTNKPTTLNIVLCVVTMLALITLDVLTIVALTASPLWKTSIIEAIFWSLIMLGVISSINMFAWMMWKEVFNNN